MNKTFDDNSAFNSNKRISRQLLEEELQYRLEVKVADCLRSDKLHRFGKAVSIALCLVGFVGVIGAMEAGSIGLVPGVILGSILTGIEAFCIRF